MSDSPRARARPGAPGDPSLPPVTEIAIATLALIVAGGIYLAAHIPQPVALGPAIGLLAAAAVLLCVNAVLVSRIRGFARTTFVKVGSWTVLAYVVIAGMLEYVFVYDHTPGRVLAVLSGMLVVFSLDVPLVLAYTVARYQVGDRTAAVEHARR